MYDWDQTIYRPVRPSDTKARVILSTFFAKEFRSSGHKVREEQVQRPLY